MSRRMGTATPEDLLLRIWDLVHRTQRFPTVQAPLMTALQEMARVLRATAANPDEAPLGTENQSPVARCVSLEDCRMQSERLRRDAANPKLHALGLDLNEGGVRSVLLARKIHIIGGLPAPAYLRRAFAQRSRPDQCNVGVVGVVLKDDRQLASAPDVGRLSRSAIGEECEGSDRPVVLVGTPHWPRAGAAVLGRGRQPAIARACDGLGRAGEQPAHFDLVALVFHSGHRRPPSTTPRSRFMPYLDLKV